MIAWIVYALAFSALLALAALAAEALLRMYGRPTRWVWAAAILLSCAGPLALAERPREGSVSFAPAPAAAGPGVLAAPAARGAPPLAQRVERVLPTLWMAASALLVAGIAAGVAVLWRRRRGWRAARLADVPVLLSHEVGPAVVGVVRPAIVVPRWTLAWAEPMQRLVVRHEGEHIRARDPLLILAATLAAAVVPWNLAVWFQLRRLRLAVEVDCDARTLRGGGDVATYGDLLLRVGARGSATALAAAFAEPRSFLERRIRAMTDRTPRNRAARAAACAVLTLGVAATGYALPAPAHPALFGTLFPAADAGPIRVRAALTSPDTAPVYDISQVDRMPSARNASEIAQGLQRAYPAHLRDSGIGGTVMVEMVVQPNGSVSRARVVNSTHPELQEPARSVAVTMRFEPARKNGAPVGVRLQIPIAFQPQGAAVTLVAPGGAAEASRPVDVSVDTVVVPMDDEPGQAVSVPSRAQGQAVTVPAGAVTVQGQAVTVPSRAPSAQGRAVTVPAGAATVQGQAVTVPSSRAPSAQGRAVTVPSRRTTTRVDTVVVPSTTTGEVLPASAGISTRGWTPSRTTRVRTAASARTNVLVTTAPTRATVSRKVAPARATVLTTTVPATKTGSSRAVTTAVAPARVVVTRAQTSTLVTTARTTGVAPARATGIAPVRARARKADPTPELLGRVIDPNAPRVPPAPAQP